MQLKWCIIGSLIFLTYIYETNGMYGCSEAIVRKVKEVDWAQCNDENQRRMQELQERKLERDELLHYTCCVLSDTMTCWADTLRAGCGDDAANELIKTATFQKDCSSWRYPESISRCQSWYSKWWFITIVAILSIVIIASVVVFVLRKRTRRT